MSVSFPCSVQKIATVKDGGVRIVVDTQELPANEIAVLFDLVGKFGKVTFEETLPTTI